LNTVALQKLLDKEALDKDPILDHRVQFNFIFTTIIKTENRTNTD